MIINLMKLMPCKQKMSLAIRGKKHGLSNKDSR